MNRRCELSVWAATCRVLGYHDYIRASIQSYSGGHECPRSQEEHRLCVKLAEAEAKVKALEAKLEDAKAELESLKKGSHA